VRKNMTPVQFGPGIWTAAGWMFAAGDGGAPIPVASLAGKTVDVQDEHGVGYQCATVPAARNGTIELEGGDWITASGVRIPNETGYVAADEVVRGVIRAEGAMAYATRPGGVYEVTLTDSMRREGWVLCVDYNSVRTVRAATPELRPRETAWYPAIDKGFSMIRTEGTP
jgi:hypothetical protein